MGVAAALIYKAASESGTSRTQSDICKVANVSEVTSAWFAQIVRWFIGSTWRGFQTMRPKIE